MSINKYALRRSVISLLYPNRCPFCGVVIGSADYFCADCDEYKNALDICKNKKNDITAYCIYNENSKPFIYAAKEKGDGYAISAAAYLLSKKLKLDDIDVVVPIPPRKAALNKRGFSFPALLAKEIASLYNIRYSHKHLIRMREISEQKGLNQAERIANVKDSLGTGTNKNSVKDLNILVIDDISTTGSTLKEAEMILLLNGAKSVGLAAFSIAHYVNNTD